MSAALGAGVRRRRFDAGRGLLAAASRYALLAQSIVEDIRKDRYAVGSLLPTEAMLCAQFGVSRHTVREALRKLGEMGLVSRRQGVGTRVKAKQCRSRYVQSIEQLSDLFTYIEETRLSIASRHDIVATPPRQAFLRCAPGQRWRMLEVLRFQASETVPMVVSEIYIPYAYCAVEREMQNLRVPIYTLIEQRYGEQIAEVQQAISACAIPAQKARLLKVRAGSPGLSITRHYLGGNDQPVLASASLYPAGRFTFSMRLRASTGDPGPGSR